MYIRTSYSALREKWPYPEFFWSAFPRIWTEYVDLLGKSPYSARMRKNTEQKNFKYGHSLRSEMFSANLLFKWMEKILFHLRIQIIGFGVFLGILGNIFL